MKVFNLGSVMLLASACSALDYSASHNGAFSYSFSHPADDGHGGPLETPEVKAAKLAHFAAHAEAKARLHKRAAWDHHATEPKWHGPEHHPVIVKGVPLDTPEVKHAKAAHAAAHAKVEQHKAYSPAHDDHHYEHAAPKNGPWHGPQHIPVIKNGVPVETPEVQHAKVAHFTAVASAGALAKSYGPEDDGSYKPHLYDH